MRGLPVRTDQPVLFYAAIFLPSVDNLPLLRRDYIPDEGCNAPTPRAVKPGTEVQV